MLFNSEPYIPECWAGVPRLPKKKNVFKADMDL